MANQRLALLLALFWFIFPFPLILLGYGNIQGIDFNSFLININPVLDSLPVGFFIFDIVKIIVTVVTALINLFLIFLNFMFIYVKVLTLTFPDVFWILGRFINIIQIITAIFIVYFLRRG